MKLRTNEIAMVENGTRRGGHKNGGTMVSDSNGVNL